MVKEIGMQSTTLNKIVSLFLVGGLVVLGLAYLLLSNGWRITLPAALQALFVGGGAGFYAVVGGLLLLPVAALLGVVCEAFTDIIIRNFVSWCHDHKLVVDFFLQGRALKDYNFWLERFKAVDKSGTIPSDFAVAPNFKGTAVGLLYRSKQAEAINWAESHYATYVLATNFALLAIVAGTYVVVAGPLPGIKDSGQHWVTGIAIAVFYSCMSLAFDRYLYSYQISLRQATIILLEEASGIEEGAGDESADTAHNLSAAPDANRALRGSHR